MINKISKFSCIFIILGLFAAHKGYCKDFSSNLRNSDYDVIVDAIYKVENSKTYPYGIKSINTHGDEAYARRICYNTVRNNYFRWQKTDKKQNYLDFLADRYCPPSADRQGNINWKKNIRKFLNSK